MGTWVLVVMKLHRHSSITLLPPPHDTADDAQVIEDWARGLDWVKWLLGSVRARTEVLMFDDHSWDDFAGGLLLETIGPALKTAWHAAHAGNLDALIASDELLSSQLPAELARRSIRAGGLLLKSTRHARHQAVLGRLRDAIAQGRCRAHITVVWATVGHLFQLSLANVIAEYLHLEWDIAMRDTPAAQKPTAGKHSIARLTSQIMLRASHEPALRVVDA
jgi:hypothetical protein